MRVRPFQGIKGANQVVIASGTSESIVISNRNKSVRIVNIGPDICYVRIGSGAQTATTSDTPILSNKSLVLAKAQDDETLAYVDPSGGSTILHIQPGEGGGMTRLGGIGIIDIPWEDQTVNTWESLTTYKWENWSK